jgi:hypothetical protein
MSDQGVFAVPIKDARRRLGNKARSEIYEDVGAGLLEAVKDGRRTLIIVRSIEARQKSWPPANIKQKTD